MYINKSCMGVTIASIILVAFLLVLRSSHVPVKLESRSKPQAKTQQSVNTQPAKEKVSQQAVSDTRSNISAVSKQSLPAVAEQADLGGLDDITVDYYSQKIDSMLDNPVHPGRAKLQEQMRNETPQATFAHLTDNDNFAMLMPVMHGRPFSPGVYESDVMIVSKMSRVRKLLADAGESPYEVADFLKRQLMTLAKEFPEQYEEYWQEHKEDGTDGHRSPELPDYMKTRILCTAAVYVLSQIDVPDSLSTLARLSAQTGSQKSESPVSRKFLLYAMHRLVQKSSEFGLSAQAEEICDRYLEKARAMNIPDAKQINVTTWNAYYHEDDFRRMLPDSKIDLSLQPTISLERFPSLEHLGAAKVEPLLRELSKLADIS